MTHHRIAIRRGPSLRDIAWNLTLLSLLGGTTRCSPDQVVGRQRNASESTLGGSSSTSSTEGSGQGPSSTAGGTSSDDGAAATAGNTTRPSSGTLTEMGGASGGANPSAGGANSGANPNVGGAVAAGGMGTDWGQSGTAGASTSLRSGVPTKISAGGSLTCAIVDGAVKCWGRNDNGQLGNGSTGNRYLPTQVQGFTTGASAIAAGSAHTCAVVRGAAYCWGYATWSFETSALGNGSATGSAVPVPVAGLSAGVTAISAGSGFSCAVMAGQAMCWGDNTWGQLGSGNTIGTVAPVPVQDLTSGVTEIAAGNATTCAIVNGGAMCWGDNAAGQLGNGTMTSSTVPVPVQGLASGVTAIAVGLFSACAVANGAAYCWGWNEFGTIPDDFAYYWPYAQSELTSEVPVQVSGLSSGVTAIALTEDTGCALVHGGVKCWGWNQYGGLGNPDYDESLSVPVPVQGLSSGVVALSAGYRHNCALMDGTVRCWGSNDAFALGIDSVDQSATPVQVQGL